MGCYSQVLPRSKLVRDPGSFGYRRLLPFLNEMAKNGNALFDSDSPRICLLRMVRFPIIFKNRKLGSNRAKLLSHVTFKCQPLDLLPD